MKPQQATKFYDMSTAELNAKKIEIRLFITDPNNKEKIKENQRKKLGLMKPIIKPLYTWIKKKLEQRN